MWGVFYYVGEVDTGILKSSKYVLGMVFDTLEEAEELYRHEISVEGYADDEVSVCHLDDPSVQDGCIYC